MLKKLWMILGLLVAGIHAQDSMEDMQAVYEAFVYSVGMSLAQMPVIEDGVDGVAAILCLCQEIPQIELIAQQFLAFDQEMVNNNVQTIEQLIDFEMVHHYDLSMAIIVMMASLQNVFIEFNKLHSKDSSFEAWKQDMKVLESVKSEEDVVKLGKYVQLYEACLLLMEAQSHLEYEFNILE